MAEQAHSKPSSRKASWKQDPEAVKADILRVATEEFAANGLSGARIDEIARQTKASKRMIYYYFGDKAGLYQAVLERVYSTMRESEDKLRVEDLDPVAALTVLIRTAFTTHSTAPMFVRLIMIENIHNADYLKQSKIVPRLNRSIIEKLEQVCARGKAQGVFHPSTDPLELHWLISAPSFFNMSNSASFRASFGEKLYTPQGQKQLEQRVVDMILGLVVIGHRAQDPVVTT